LTAMVGGSIASTESWRVAGSGGPARVEIGPASPRHENRREFPLHDGEASDF
jgi:hypothetical protein